MAFGTSEHYNRALSSEPSASLRVLLANERADHMRLVAVIVESLGHTVVATSTEVAEVGALTTDEHPDVALVGLGENTQHALDLIDQIVREASCPVIALLLTSDRAFVDQAAKLGIFAYIVDAEAEELQGALDITLSRFREYHSLQGAFGRRAIIECAKGILMERHKISRDDAFALLRHQSGTTGNKLIVVAEAVVDGHALLPPRRTEP